MYYAGTVIVIIIVWDEGKLFRWVGVVSERIKLQIAIFKANKIIYSETCLNQTFFVFRIDSCLA